jgi:hypothetical protein
VTLWCERRHRRRPERRVAIVQHFGSALNLNVLWLANIPSGKNH